MDRVQLGTMELEMQHVTVSLFLIYIQQKYKRTQINLKVCVVMEYVIQFCQKIVFPAQRIAQTLPVVIIYHYSFIYYLFLFIFVYIIGFRCLWRSTV